MAIIQTDAALRPYVINANGLAKVVLASSREKAIEHGLRENGSYWFEGVREATEGDVAWYLAMSGRPRLESIG